MRWLFATLAGCGFSPALSDASSTEDTSDAEIDGALPPIPIVYVQERVTFVGGGQSSHQAGFTLPQQAGNMNFVVLSMLEGTNKIKTISDTAGNTYVSLGFLSHGNYGQLVWYAPNIKAAPAGNVVRVTFMPDVNSPELRLVEYGGLEADPYETSATSTGMSTKSDSAPVTTTHAHDLLVGVNTVSQMTVSADPLFTQRIIVQGDLLEDREVFAPGTYNATATISPSAEWTMLLVAFRGLR